MEKQELPLGFGFALAQNPEAMKNFSALPQPKQEEVIQRAHQASSKDAMQSLMDELASAQ